MNGTNVIMGVFQEDLPQKSGKCKHLSSTTLRGKIDYVHMRCQFKGKVTAFLLTTALQHKLPQQQCLLSTFPQRLWRSWQGKPHQVSPVCVPDLTCFCTHRLHGTPANGIFFSETSTAKQPVPLHVRSAPDYSSHALRLQAALQPLLLYSKGSICAKSSQPCSAQREHLGCVMEDWKSTALLD